MEIHPHYILPSAKLTQLLYMCNYWVMKSDK